MTRVYIATKASSKLIRDAKKAEKKGQIIDWNELLSRPEAQGTTTYKGLKL